MTHLHGLVNILKQLLKNSLLGSTLKRLKVCTSNGNFLKKAQKDVTQT